MRRKCNPAIIEMKGKPTLGDARRHALAGQFEVIGNSGILTTSNMFSEYSPGRCPCLIEIGRTMELFRKMALMVKSKSRPGTW